MLELIIPPIILVLALASLVYYFSKRLPALQMRIDRGEVKLDDQAHSSVWKDRVKHAALGLLEKSIRRWKIGLLKAHNRAHELTDNLRRQREASRERLLRSEETKHEQVGERERIFEEVTRKNDSYRYEEKDPMITRPIMPNATSEPVVQRPMTQLSTAEKTLQQNEFEPVPPITSRFIRTRPSRTESQRSVRQAPYTDHFSRSIHADANQGKEQLETLLIERIVTNPKDVEAYERLGDYYLEQESFIDAKECYRQVLKLSPVNRMVKIKIRRLERVLEKR